MSVIVRVMLLFLKRLFTLLLGCQTLAALGGEVQPFGVHLRTVLNRDIVEVDTLISSAERRQQLAAARDRIDALELTQGPYAPALAEALLEVAREAEILGETGLALELYGWALQNTRINTGLYDEAQLPILERTIEVLREQGDAAAVLDRAGYRFRLLGSGAPPWTSQKLAAAVQWLEIQNEFLADPSVFFDSHAALDAFRQAKDLSESVCNDPEWAEVWCKPLSLQFLALMYLIDFYIDPLVEEGAGIAQYPVPPRSQASWSTNPSEERLLAIERSLATQGERCLVTALSVTPDDTELKLAGANWAWFSGRRSTALDAYRALVKESPGLLKVASPIPELPLIDRDPRLVDRQGGVRLEFRVTRAGEARDVVAEDAVSTEGNQESLARFARRQIGQLRFRPAFNEQGESTESMLNVELLVLRR